MIWIRKNEQKLYCLGLRNPQTYEDGEYQISFYKRESTRCNKLSKLDPIFETIEFEIDLSELIDKATRRKTENKEES